MEPINRTPTGCVDDHFYSDTRMFRFVRDAITKNQCVLIHGETGCGKSALMNHVARSLHQNDYVLKQITKFSEIDPDPSLESKTLYLFDDAFGIFNCDVSFIDTLEHYSDVEVLLRHKHSKLLLTSRSSVYRKIEKFNFSVVFHVIDLNDPTLSLSNDEKKGIIQSICREPSAEYLDKAGKCENNSFPLLCVLFSDYHGLQESPHNFFVNPNKAFLSFLDTLQNNEMLTYYSLVFVALNGRIRSPLDYANDSNVNEKLIFVKQACTQHCNENFSFEDLAKEIKKLVEDTRWFKEDDCDLYIFRHTFVYEIVAYHYGKNNIKDILACVGCSFIAEKILLENEINEEYPTHLTLLVDIEMLQERLLADIRDMENFDVFTNACWENSSFCNTFQRTLQEFTKLGNDELFWGSKYMYAQIVTSKCIYGTKLSEKKEKGYISLRHNESEWFRQKLLEDRSEKVIENSIQFEREIKAISWVIGYKIFRILPDILKIKKGNRKIEPVSVFDSIEQIRLLTLAILSENEDCFDIVLNYVDLQNINSNCQSSYSLDQPTYNKHRKFTPLTIACYKGFSAAIRKLVEKGCEVNLKDQNGSIPLVLACRFASYSDCMYLVKKGTNLNCTNKSGVTPLIASVMSRNTDIVNFLLENNVAINQCTVRGKSPLYYAAKRGCSEIVGILIKKEASVNILDKAGKSPLFWTAQNGYLNIAKILIDNKADVNQWDSKGKSPLYCASKGGHFQIAKLLIQKGANVNITTHHNKTSLYRAAKRGYTDICKVLIEKYANVNKADWKGCTPLYWASKRGHFDIVIVLLKNGASPDNKNDKEKAALHSAAQAGYVNIAKSLVDNGANVNIKDTRKRTPLYFASKRGHVDMVKYLIKCGSSINTPTVGSKSALFGAAKRNHVDVLKELIANNADVNLSDENGESPLYFAAQRGHLEVVRILLQEGADVNSSCKNNQTALYWASQGGYFAFAQLLVERGANIHHKADRDKTSLYCASKRGYLNIVQLLVEKGADVDCRNNKKQTPLLRACKRNHLKVVKYLLNHGADVNLKDVNGETPLLWAAENGHFDVVKMLICTNKCYINDSNVVHQTPIYRAAKYGHIEIVNHLLLKGGDKTIADKYGRSPVEMAQRMGHMDIVQILR